MLKKFLFIVFGLMLCGCVNTPSQIDVIDGGNAFSTNCIQNSDFNKETYVWENWSQSTNSTDIIIR